MKPSLVPLVAAALLASGAPAHAQRTTDDANGILATAASSPALAVHQLMLRRAADLSARWAAGRGRTSPTASVTEPSLVAGKFLTPTFNVTKAPGLPKLQLTLQAGSVGISYISITLVSPSGLHYVDASIYLPEYPPEPAVETLPIQVASPFAGGNFNLYSEPGVWTISNILLLSRNGQFISYSGDALKAVFPNPTVNVLNPGTPDITPPTVSTGAILTRTISLSGTTPYFLAKLAVKDNLSGVANAYVSLSSPFLQSPLGAYTTLTAPLLNGEVKMAGQIPLTAPTGTYTVNSLTVCDVAQNCFSVTTPTTLQQIFGTLTFKVTK